MFRIVIAVFFGLLVTTSNAQLNTIENQLVLVKGSNDTIPVFGADLFGDEDDSIPEYLVNELKDFYISKTCVSVGDYQKYCEATSKVMPVEPAWGWGDTNKPMVNISYQDAVAYTLWLGTVLQVAVRLPHQEEWIYAANNGGFVDPVYFDAVPETIQKIAVYKTNGAANGPVCITCKQPNALGIYNMLGNVWEWTDGWFFNADEEETVTDEDLHMIVGGSYSSPKSAMYYNKALMIPESTMRSDVGFRVAISVEDFLKAKLVVKLNDYLKEVTVKEHVLHFSPQGILLGDSLIAWADFSAITVDYQSHTIAIDYNDASQKRKTAYVSYPTAKDDEMAVFHKYFLVISDYLVP